MTIEVERARARRAAQLSETAHSSSNIVLQCSGADAESLNQISNAGESQFSFFAGVCSISMILMSVNPVITLTPVDAELSGL